MTDTSLTQESTLLAAGSCRDPNILLAQLVVGHLLALAAYTYVLRLRRERITFWPLLYYCLIPVGPLAWQVLAIAALILLWKWDIRYQILATWTFLLYCFWGTRGVRACVFSMAFAFLLWPFNFGNPNVSRNVRQVLRWTMGLDVLLEKTREAPDESEGDSPDDSQRSQQTQRSVWRITYNLLLPTAFLTVCLATLAVCLRHWWHGTSTVLDKRLFELAASGILTTVYWIGYTVDIPPFTTSNTLGQEEKTLAQAKPDIDEILKDITPFPTDLNRTLLFYCPALISISLTENLFDLGQLTQVTGWMALLDFLRLREEQARAPTGGSEVGTISADGSGTRAISKPREVLGEVCMRLLRGFFVVGGIICPLYGVMMGGLELYLEVKDLEMCSGLTVSLAALQGLIRPFS